MYYKFYINNFTKYGLNKKLEYYNNHLMKILPIVKRNKRFIESNKKLYNYPLRDFYIFSSHNTFISRNQNMDTNSLLMIKNSLLLGVREIELDIYAKNWLGKGEKDHEPIVTHGMIRGIGKSDVFSNTNLLPLDKCFYIIKKYMNYNGNTDPLIINIELNTHHLNYTNIKIIKLLKKYFGDKLYLPKNKNRNMIEDVPIKDLINKVIIVIHNINKTNLLYDYSHDYCNISSNENNIISLNYTKNKMSRIYPCANINSHFSYNIDPVKYWNRGIQLVSCNIQNIDDNLKEHFKKFKYYSFVLKPKIFRKKNNINI